MSFLLFLREKIFLDSKIKKSFTDILIYPRLILEDNSEINILPGDKMKEIPVQLEGDYELIINSYSHQGEGIGRINNFAVFIPGAISGEKARVKITEAKKNFARGQCNRIHSNRLCRQDSYHAGRR